MTARATPEDIVIDLDVTRARATNRTISHGSRQGLPHALMARNQQIRALASEQRRVCAYLIVGAPTAAERERWAGQLNPVAVYVLATPAEVCIGRIKNRNPDRWPELAQAVERWWAEYQPRKSDITIA